MDIAAAAMAIGEAGTSPAASAVDTVSTVDTVLAVGMAEADGAKICSER
jgi:hypothetical protein